MLKTSDIVRFKGDPDSERFRVVMKNHDGSIEIENGSSHFDWIPERLLEKVAPKLEPGQVWKHVGSDTPFFIVDVSSDGSEIVYTFPKCNSPVYAEPTAFGGEYQLAYPKEEEEL